MTKKSDLQQELLEKVKPGAKPSDIIKLKRSKSANDIAQIPIAPLPPDHLLTDQLKEKQQQIETLRKDLETANQKLKETKQQLDDSLVARIAGLQVFGKEHESRTQVEQELNETIDQASSELQQGDDEVSQLKQKVYVLKSAKEQLERELKLSRLNRSTLPLTSNNYETKLDYFQYSLYALMAIWFILLLNNSWKKNHA